jgi:hypothetical protein
LLALGFIDGTNWVPLIEKCYKENKTRQLPKSFGRRDSNFQIIGKEGLF